MQQRFFLLNLSLSFPAKVFWNMPVHPVFLPPQSLMGSLSSRDRQFRNRSEWVLSQKKNG